MVDHLSEEKRSWNMSRIKSGNTKPERIVRSLLHRKGLRFRLHKKELPGKPDIVLPKHRTAIFIHGCFWHRHKGCKDATMPKSNISFWVKKLSGNAERDKRKYRELKKAGWQVIVIWECEVEKSPDTSVEKILRFLHQPSPVPIMLIAAEDKSSNQA